MSGSVVSASAAAQPPGMFVRGAPKTVPPPLPQLSVKPSSSASLSHSGSVSLQSVSGSASFSSSVSLSQHSRHSSASVTLAAVEEDAVAESRIPPPLQVEDGKGELVVSAIEEEEEEEKQMAEDEPENRSAAAEQQEEKQPELEDDDDDDDDGDDEEERLEEDDEETEETEGPDGQSAPLALRSDAPARTSGAAPLPAASPVSRAFAIFGREIRHVTPNSSLSLSSPPAAAASVPFARKTPRTVPPPLPALTPASPPSVVPSPVNPRISVPTLSVPLLRANTGDAPSPLLTPLTPVTPGSPAAPSPVLTGESAAVASTPLLRGMGESFGSTPTGPPPPPPAARSAASSVVATVPPPLPKDRQSLPVGFQFSHLKLNARAAAACSLTSGSTGMSASSPIHPTSTPGDSPSPCSHASTAPCLLSSSSTRNGAATVSEPSSPRRLPSSTVSGAGTPGQEPPVMLRPTTADGSAAEPARRARGEEADRKDAMAAAAAAGRAAVSDSAAALSGEGGATQKQKCSKCVSFSVRGSYCLKHLYHAGLAALASPSASSPLPRLSATLHPSSAAYTERMLKVADELYKTEKSYYEALKVAYRSFQLRLEVAAALAENPGELLSGLQSAGGEKGGGAGKAHAGVGLLPVLSSAEISTIFSKLHDIFTLSSNLYHDLTTLNSCRVHAEPDAASSSASASHSLTLLLPFLGSTLLHYASYFRVYQPYLENYDDAIRSLVALRSANAPLDVWLTWQEKCEQSALDSLLIMPVQRLPRYLLLLQEIVRCEEQRRAADTPGLFAHYPLAYHDILTARDRIARIADAINLSLHEKEAAQTVSHLQSLFDQTDSKFVPFATPTRKLVKDGLLRKMNETRKSSFLGSSSSSYRFFLFNDLLIAADESKKLGGVTRYRLKYTIPLLDLRVVDGGDDAKAAGGAGGAVGAGGKELRLRNEVSGKMLRISGKSAEEMAEWRQRIEQCQSVLKELTDSLHVTTFDGVVQDKKERAHKSKAMQMMGIGGAAADTGRGGKAAIV